MADKNSHSPLRVALPHTEHIPQPMGIRGSDFQAIPLSGMGKDGSTVTPDLGIGLVSQQGHSNKENISAPAAQLH